MAEGRTSRVSRLAGIPCRRSTRSPELIVLALATLSHPVERCPTAVVIDLFDFLVSKQAADVQLVEVFREQAVLLFISLESSIQGMDVLDKLVKGRRATILSPVQPARVILASRGFYDEGMVELWRFAERIAAWQPGEG